MFGGADCFELISLLVFGLQCPIETGKTDTAEGPGHATKRQDRTALDFMLGYEQEG